jgi:hypothetical protein
VSALAAVLRVRSLLERRATAEHARAERALEAARAEVASARDARTAHQPPAGPTSRPGLTGDRLGALALHEHVLRAGQGERTAARDAELAGKRRVEAAVARRSVERLAERRNAATAAIAAKRVERQLDDLAIDRWRRS